MTDQYKVTFETISPHIANDLRAEFGKDYWKHAPQHMKDGAQWHCTERVTTDAGSAKSQFQTLQNWESEGGRPIRNARLYRSSETPWQQVAGGLPDRPDVPNVPQPQGQHWRCPEHDEPATSVDSVYAWCMSCRRWWIGKTALPGTPDEHRMENPNQPWEGVPLAVLVSELDNIHYRGDGWDHPMVKRHADLVVEIRKHLKTEGLHNG